MGAFTAPMVSERVDVRLLVLVAPMIPSAGESPGEWWSTSGQKRAFLAPFPEMNGEWTPYNVGGPSAFIAAYHRIRRIFEEDVYR